MTIDIPSPVIPADMTIAVAMSQGLLPGQIQITGFGLAADPSLEHLLSTGAINGNALASTLTFSSPNAKYNGN